MAELTLKDLAVVLGLLTTVFGFHWRFVRPDLVSTATWRTKIEARLDRTDEMLVCMKEMKNELVAIKTKIAVLEERSKSWGN